MAKYLKKFETTSDYESYMSNDPLLPNVSSIQGVGVRFTRSGGPQPAYGYVDLGLPSGILWATCNVGASSPEQIGNLYAIGETQPKNAYTLENFLYATETETGFTIDYSFIEYSDEHDAAKVNMGDEWNTPIYSYLSELLQNTTSAVTVLNGVSGVTFTSNVNQNSIFVPMADYDDYTFETDSEDAIIKSSLEEVHYNQGAMLRVTDGVLDVANNREVEAFWIGMPVRGIRVPAIMGGGTQEYPFIIRLDTALTAEFAEKVKHMFDNMEPGSPIYYVYGDNRLLTAYLDSETDPETGEPTGNFYTEFSTQNDDVIVDDTIYENHEEIPSHRVYVTIFTYTSQGAVISHIIREQMA